MNDIEPTNEDIELQEQLASNITLKAVTPSGANNINYLADSLGINRDAIKNLMEARNDTWDVLESMKPKNTQMQQQLDSTTRVLSTRRAIGIDR